MSSPSSPPSMTLLEPADAASAAQPTSFSSLVVQTPRFIAPVCNAADVAAALRAAAARQLPVYLQATGHGCAPVDGGLLISTRAMTGVSIDPAARTATVQAGAVWSQVIEAAAEHGLAPRSGSSPDVGVIGYTLGGGVPITARTFGFASDAVLSVDVVLADGSQLTIDAEHEPELFWGLRGGRGPFCVVTAMTFGLDPLPSIYGGALYFAGEHAPQLLTAYRDWVTGLPGSLSTSIALYRLPPLPQVPEPLRGVLSVAVRIVHVGDPAEADALIAPLLEVAPLLLGGTKVMAYAASAPIYNDPPGPLPALGIGSLLRELTDADITALLAVAGPGHDIPFPKIEIRHLGGALGHAPAGIDAVSGRHGAFVAHFVGVVTPQTAQLVPALNAAIVAAFEPAAAGGQQVNFAAHDVAGVDVWGTQVFSRLVAIKAGYDPTNLLRGPIAFIPAPRQLPAGG